MKKKAIIESLDELESFAEVFAEKHVSPSKNQALMNGQATVVALSGELGAGKTTFTREVAKVLGADGNVTSPTFVLMKKYALKKSADFSCLVHIDAYRLESGVDLEPVGWSRLLADPQNLIFIEWPERVSEAIPKDAIELSFAVDSEHTRLISFN